MNKEYLLWIDIETTGLNPSLNEILEIAYVLTDFDLKNIYCEKNFIVKQKKNYDEILLNLDKWCMNQHTNSGLLKKVKEATSSIEDIENEILTELSKHTETKSSIYLAGNSVHFDKSFINHYMKNLSTQISYRILDVSSFSITCKNLNGEIYDKCPLKKYKHTALSDIWESINEYAYYLENFLNLKR